MESTTTAWLLYEITKSPVLLGLGGAVRAVSTITFGLIGGAVADRFPRRRLLFITQSSFALSSLALGLLVVTGNVQFWHIYVFSAVNGAIGSFDGPARRSLFPTLVPRSDMQSAVMLNSAAIRTGRLIGPSIAGVIIAAYGPAISYFVNVVSYSAILIALATMHIREAPLARGGHILGAAFDGVRYMVRKPLLRSVLILESITSVFGLNTALVTIIASELNAGPTGLGLLLTSQSAGSLLGTSALVLTGDLEHKGRTMIAAGLGYATALAALGSAASLEIGAAIIFVSGLTDALWSTIRTTIVQLETEAAYRGRSMGVLLLSGRGLTQLSQLEGGLAVSVGGPAFALALGGALIASVVIAVNAMTPEIRGYRGSPDPFAAIAADGVDEVAAGSD